VFGISPEALLKDFGRERGLPEGPFMVSSPLMRALLNPPEAREYVDAFHNI